MNRYAPSADLAAVSRVTVALHKKQFGRGPQRARAHFAGPDTLLCILEDALLPSEQQLIALGQSTLVREARDALHTAGRSELVNAIEQLVLRKVRACSIAVDPVSGTVFEILTFEQTADAEDLDDAGAEVLTLSTSLPAERAPAIGAAAEMPAGAEARMAR